MISVVIPLYNKAQTIVNTINTVLNQTFQAFEIVVVDDGSTDDGYEILTSSIDDIRMRIIRQPNRGVSAARNSGVLEANFGYIAFLDGDDQWMKTYLEKMVEAIALYPEAGMICCAGVVRNANGSEFFRLAKKYKDQTIKINFFENPHVFLHTSATIVKKSEFLNTKGFPVGMKRNQDYALFFSLALITPVVYCGYPLSIYVGGIEGQATSTPLQSVLEHVVNRFNIVFNNWTNTPNRNQIFKVFMKYELRQMFLIGLKNLDYDGNKFILDNLNSEILKCFPKAELNMYRTPALNKLAHFYILSTKVIWRQRGFPYLGQNNI